MEYTYCRECGARAEKDNPLCTNCGSSDIGQTYSEMTSEEKKRALAMMDYKKCPKCGKLMPRSLFLCVECIGKIIKPLSDLDQKIKSKLPGWMLDKPAKHYAEHYFCSDCFARMEENASSCLVCGAAVGCKKFSEMSDEEKKWAYKHAKADKKFGFFVFILSIAALIGWITIMERAYSITFDFKQIIYIVFASILAGVVILFMLVFMEMLRQNGFFERAKGVKQAIIIEFAIVQILGLIFMVILQ